MYTKSQIYRLIKNDITKIQDGMYTVITNIEGVNKVK